MRQIGYSQRTILRHGYTMCDVTKWDKLGLARILYYVAKTRFVQFTSVSETGTGQGGARRNHGGND